MKSEKQVGQAFEDHIRKIGAPVGLKSNNAKSELHGCTKDIPHLYSIDDAQSEPQYQHQNEAERKIQDVKHTMNNAMDRTGCPARVWLLCVIFTLMLFCHLPNSNGEIPLAVQMGQIPDISKIMHFHFWQEVLVESHHKDTTEELARWCYPAEGVGDELTYMVLLTESEQLVPRSNVQPATDPLYSNFRKRPYTNMPIPTSSPFKVETVDDDDDDDEYGNSSRMTAPSGEPVQSGSPIYNVQDRFDVPVNLPQFSPEELLGLTFLYDTGDGEHVCAKIVKKIHDRDAENHERIKMLILYDDDRVEELISYNELCDLVAEQHDREASGEDEVFMFCRIVDHKGPLKAGDSEYNGSRYNVKIEWEDAGVTTWPLHHLFF